MHGFLNGDVSHMLFIDFGVHLFVDCECYVLILFIKTSEKCFIKQSSQVEFCIKNMGANVIFLGARLGEGDKVFASWLGYIDDSVLFAHFSPIKIL